MILWVILAICGLITHFLKQIVQARNSGKKVDIILYWKNNRLETIISIVGSLALFSISLETGMMNGLVAFSCGYMGNSAADIIGDRANSIGKS